MQNSGENNSWTKSIWKTKKEWDANIKRDLKEADADGTG